MEDRLRRNLEHTVSFARELATKADGRAKTSQIERMVGYDNGCASTYRVMANLIEDIIRDEDEMNGLVPSQDECPACGGLGREAGRACSMCGGRGFAPAPPLDVPGSTSADAPFR